MFKAGDRVKRTKQPIWGPPCFDLNKVYTVSKVTSSGIVLKEKIPGETIDMAWDERMFILIRNEKTYTYNGLEYV